MVRILAVRQLEDRKRALVAQSEMHRQTMGLEIANLKYSLALLRRRLGFLKLAPLSAGVLGSLVGWFLGRGQPRRTGGFFTRIFSSESALGLLSLLLKRFTTHQHAKQEPAGPEPATEPR